MLQEVDVLPDGLRAVDGDVGQNTSVRYSLVDTPVSSLFSIDPVSGRLFLTSHLDRESLTDPSLTLHVRAEQVRVHYQSIYYVLVSISNSNMQLSSYLSFYYDILLRSEFKTVGVTLFNVFYEVLIDLF